MQDDFELFRFASYYDAMMQYIHDTPFSGKKPLHVTPHGHLLEAPRLPVTPQARQMQLYASHYELLLR